MTFECPGEGVCERFTGAAGDTDDEKFEEASPGCERNCKTLRRRSAESEDAADENDYLFERIQDLFEENKVFPLNAERIKSLEYFESECLIFWQKAVDMFETEWKTTLRILARSFFKNK